MALRFTDLEPALCAQNIQAIASFGFTHMTPVQASTIPQFLKNKDVCVEATTGSGKTLAFGLPIFEIIRRCVGESTPGKHDVYALIMAPTRELASQIHEVICKIGQFHPSYTISLMVGGTHVNECCTAFERDGGHILIGTPGRVLDVKNRISTLLTFKKLEVLVLDEADTLLDMGFKDTINQLLAILPKQRRTGLFSATQTKEVSELARAGLRNPVRISVRVQSRAAPTVSDQNNGTNSTNNSSNNSATSVAAMGNIQQATPSTLDNSYLVCPHDQRPDELVHFLNTHRSAKIIVFCATCACVDYYSNVFAQIAQQGKLLPKDMQIVGFHGKMVPKKRTLLYRKFVALSSGVLFCTDVAARGVDIPDVEWIVQLAAPKDPAFFVHRVGRTARAGKAGGALLFVTAEEQSYVDLLRGRGVPLRERPPACATLTHAAADTTIETVTGTSECRSPLLKAMKLLAMTDRTVLEAGSTAFMAFLRAYKEHLCSYIFRFDQLDIGAVARSYALLRLPKIPETRGVKGKPIVFEITNIDTSTIPYPHKEQEEARQRRLKAMYEAAAEQDQKQLQGQDDRARGSKGDHKKRPRAHEQDQDGDHSGEEGSERDNQSDSGSASSEEDDNGSHLREEPTTTKFTPHAIFLPKTKEQKKQQDSQRKRKQKAGLHKQIMDEWDDLAAEEMAYKKFKKGQISKEEYENCLFSDKKLALDPVTGQPLLRKGGGGGGGDDGSSGSDENSGGSDSDHAAVNSKGKGQQKGKQELRLQYQSDSGDSEDSSDGEQARDHRGSGGGKKGKGGGKGGGVHPQGGKAHHQKHKFDGGGDHGHGGQRKDFRRVKSGHSFPGSAPKKRNH